MESKNSKKSVSCKRQTNNISPIKRPVTVEQFDRDKPSMTWEQFIWYRFNRVL